MSARLFIVLLFFVAGFADLVSQDHTPQTAPNVILILADDLGYGELGCYGQKVIETPNIDRLASEGMRFVRHYSGAAVCAPARCILLTGKHAGHAYIRGNDEWKSRGDVWNYTAVFEDPGLEGQRPMPASEVTLAELLQANGYKTGMVGKWGLGAPGSESTPNAQGFDYFYGYNCQRQAHTLYPGHLWENDTKVLLNNRLVSPHTSLDDDSDPDDPASYSDFQLTDYAPQLMHEKGLDFIRKNASSPFFLMYASPLPHLPLQAPEEQVARYRETLVEEGSYTGDNGYFPTQHPRATYAAMISTLDQQVGEIVALIDELDLGNNTIILFTSDNGPTYTGGADTEFFQSAHPFSTAYGRGKGFLYEGGIRVPLIARWPGQVPAGSTSDLHCAFYDYLPTIAELCVANGNDHHDGISFVDELMGRFEEQEEHAFLYWEQPEYGGQMAVRTGPWKGIIKEMKRGNNKMELYNMDADSLEQNDLSDQYPEQVRKLRRLIMTEHRKPEVRRFYFPLDTARNQGN